MHLVLRAVALGGAPLTQTLSGHFDERGGTLGRSDENTLTLPDPNRHISRHHAQVAVSRSGYSIRNIGSANPILLNERSVAPGESAALADGDELQIGAYLLRVCVMPDDETLAPVAVSAAAAAPAAPLPPDFSFGQKPAPAHPWSHDPAEMLHPVGMPHNGSLDGLTAHDRVGRALERFLDGGNASVGTSTVPNGSPESSRPPQPPPPGAPCRADLVHLVSPSRPPPPPQALPAAYIDRTPDVHAAMLLPPSPAAARMPSLPQPEVDIDVDAVMAAPTLANDASTHAELWRAFCEGTGMPLTPPQGLTPQMMHTIGQLMRHLVGGTVQLVHMRAETKHELRFPATMLRTHDNNPLRYSPNVQAALTQLLLPPLSGFMAGPQAAQEAMDDLFAHAIGTMTGMRAAIEGVLRRFEPPRLEAQITGSQVLDALLPMHRRARLWDLYLQHFESVRAEAKEDFDRLFGQAFVDAYERQLDRLDVERGAERPAQM